MTTQNQSEKDRRSATASLADADAEAEAPAERRSLIRVTLIAAAMCCRCAFASPM